MNEEQIKRTETPITIGYQTLENLAKELRPILEKYPDIMNSCGRYPQYMDFGAKGKIEIRYPNTNNVKEFKLVITKLVETVI